MQRRKTNLQAQSRLTYSVPELAELLGVGRSGVYSALRRGILPARRFGRRFVISRAAVDDWLRLQPAEVKDNILDGFNRHP
jgi:excisionase family DNA binding protein